MLKRINNKNGNYEKLQFLIYKILFCFFLIITYHHYYLFEFSSKVKVKSTLMLSKNLDYENKSFIIIERDCPSCGLFSFYIVCLGCIHKYLLEGYIPIIDLKSLPNVLNGFNSLKINIWDLFFQQPFGYTLEKVLKNGKNISRIRCYDCRPRLNSYQPFDEISLNFWHNFAEKYSYIKKEIFLE